MNASFMEAITNYGLAVVIAGYLVWWITKKLNSKLDTLTQNIAQLNTNIERLIDKLER